VKEKIELQKAIKHYSIPKTSVGQFVPETTIWETVGSETSLPVKLGGRISPVPATDGK
jgi:hypothetical protein